MWCELIDHHTAQNPVTIYCLGSETEYAAKFNKSPVLPVAQKQNILASTPENFKTVVQLRLLKF